jgi:hypothetical protein
MVLPAVLLVFSGAAVPRVRLGLPVCATASCCTVAPAAALWLALLLAALLMLLLVLALAVRPALIGKGATHSRTAGTEVGAAVMPAAAATTVCTSVPAVLLVLLTL